MCNRFSINVRSFLSAFAWFKKTGGDGRPELKDAYSASLKLISGTSNLKGGKRTLAIKICDRHIFAAFSASPDFIHTVSSLSRMP